MNIDKNELRLLLRFSLVFISIFFLYLISNYFLIRFLALRDIETSLLNTTNQVVNDFDYSDSKWNTSKYLSDVTVPSDIPLYIYSLDGFLIDRNNIISGFLDTSNYSYASSFTTPKSLDSPIGESWRVFSYPIIRENQTRGVIITAFFDPGKISESEINNILLETSRSLDKKIILSQNTLDISKVRPNEVHPDVSFEIVDSFNRSLMSVGGPPAYIDKSYIQNILSDSNFTYIRDKKTNEQFLLKSQQIKSGNDVIGIVVAGKGLSQLNQFLNNQIKISLIAAGLAIVVLFISAIYIFRHDIPNIVQERLSIITTSSLIKPEKLYFDEAQSKIIINSNHPIGIPKDSYQYDICKLFFRHPSKKYDTFDLSDAIGENEETKNTRRMVYDAVEAINARTKKVIELKLILLDAKEYFINPELASKIS